MNRSPAKRIWIKNLREGEYSPSSGGYDPNKLIYNGEEFIRVRVLGTVVDKYDSDKFSAITVKDESGEVNVRFFQDDTEWTQDVTEGDLVRVIGKVRKREDEIVLNGEIVRKLENPAWMELHQKQLKARETKEDNTETKEEKEESTQIEETEI